MPTNADLAKRLRAYPKPLLSDDPKLFEHIIAHLERTAALEATPTPIKLEGFEAAWERYHSFLVEKIRSCEHCQLWGDAYNKFMELCPVNKAIEEPVPPSDTSAERVAESEELEHVAPGDPVAAGVEWTAEQLKAGLADVAAQRPKLDGDKVHEALWGIIFEERREVAKLEGELFKSQASAFGLEGKVAQLTKERDEARDHNAFLEHVVYEKRKAAAAAQQRAEEAEAYKTRWHSLTGWILDRLSAGEIYCKGNYEAWKAGLGVAYDRIKELDPNVIADMDAAPAAEPDVPRPEPTAAEQVKECLLAMEAAANEIKAKLLLAACCLSHVNRDTATGETPTLEQGLTFKQLREANIRRLPTFKNCHGEPAHSEPDGSDWSPAQWLQAVVGELGEYANLRKKFERGDISTQEFETEAAKELADVQTYLDILAFRLGIDLGAATVKKFNEVSERIRSHIFIRFPALYDTATADLTPREET